MQITSAIAGSLGEKLAALDLTDAEGALLRSLLAGGEIESEVSGFSARRTGSAQIMFETFRKESLPQVLGPLPGAWQLEIEGYVVTPDLQK